MKTKSKVMLATCASLIGSVAPLQAVADQAVPPQGKTFSGTISSVDIPDHTIALKGMLWSKHFNVGSSCNFNLPDNPPGSISDLRLGERVTVHYQNDRGVLIADRVAQKPMRMEGRVASIDPGQRTLTLHRNDYSKKMILASNCKVELRNGATGSLANVPVGSLVNVTYETAAKTLVAHEIDQTSLNYAGSVTAIDLNEKTIKAKSLAGAMKFNLADDCVFVLDGNANAKLDDIRPDERLVFSYDEVNGIDVVNRVATDESPPIPAHTNNVVSFMPSAPY